MRKAFEKLKAKWQIENDRDFWLIMLTFSLAGLLLPFERKPIFHFLGITDATPLWVKIVIYLPCIMPFYQLNLLVFGTVLGQFQFFWEKEKRLGRFLWSIITGKRFRV